MDRRPGRARGVSRAKPPRRLSPRRSCVCPFWPPRAPTFCNAIGAMLTRDPGRGNICGTPMIARRREMPAYWVARAKIHDPAEYKKYTDLVPAILAKHGGKVLARGGRYRIMEGPDKFHRFVVVEFPSYEQAVACFQSSEYNAAAAFRRSGAGEVETIIVDGGEPTK